VQAESAHQDQPERSRLRRRCRGDRLKRRVGAIGRKRQSTARGRHTERTGSIDDQIRDGTETGFHVVGAERPVGFIDKIRDHIQSLVQILEPDKTLRSVIREIHRIGQQKTPQARDRYSERVLRR